MYNEKSEMSLISTPPIAKKGSKRDDMINNIFINFEFQRD